MKLVGKSGRLLSKTPGRLLRIHNFYVVGGTIGTGVNRVKKYDSDGELEFDTFNLATVHAVIIDQAEYIYIGHSKANNISIRQLDFEDGSILSSYILSSDNITNDLSLDLRRNIYKVGFGGSSSYRLRKINPSGDTLFLVPPSGGTLSSRGVSGDRENNVVSGVYFTSTNRLQKHTSTGDELWANNLSGGTAHSISTDINSHIYVASFASISTQPGLYKFNPNGTQLWSVNNIASQESVDGRRVNSNGDVEVVCCGGLVSGANVRKYAGATGNLVWAVNLAGVSYKSLSVDLAGDIVLGSAPNGSPNKNVRKIDGVDGTLIWDLLTASDQTINSVKAT